MVTLAAHLRQRWHLLLCCPGSRSGTALLERASAMGIETLALTGGRNPAALKRHEALSSFGADIFHIHAGVGWEGIAAVKFARDTSVPVVLRTDHLPYLLTDPYQQRAYAEAVQMVDRVICVSDGVCQTLVAAGTPAHKLAVVRNGIDPLASAEGRDEVRRSLGLAQDARLILTIGRFTRQKGHQFLARAAVRVLEREPNAHFLWVGRGPRRRKLRHLVNRLGIGKQVHFQSRSSNVSDLLGAADLFVLPSLFEGLPLVVLEAMAAGTPVIGTRVCGTDETIVDGVTGRLVPPRDSRALADAVLEALSYPELAAAWSSRARLKWEREFSAAHMVRETEAIYLDCLARATENEYEGLHAGSQSSAPTLRSWNVEVN